MPERTSIAEALCVWWNDPEADAALQIAATWQTAAQTWWEDLTQKEQFQWRKTVRHRCGIDSASVEYCYLLFLGLDTDQVTDEWLLHAYMAGAVPRHTMKRSIKERRHSLEDIAHFNALGTTPPWDKTVHPRRDDPVTAAERRVVSDLLAKGFTFRTTPMKAFSDRLGGALLTLFADTIEDSLPQEEAEAVLHGPPSLFQSAAEQWLHAVIGEA